VGEGDNFASNRRVNHALSGFDRHHPLESFALVGSFFDPRRLRKGLIV